MLKKIAALLLALFAVAAFAAVDVNKATQAELDGIKGIGPAIAGKILDERKKGAFKDWSDFIDRVKGVGEGNAAKFSAEGLTINGAGFKGVAAMPAKPAAAAAPVAPATKATPPTAEEKKAAATAKEAEAKKAGADKATAAKAAKEGKDVKPAVAAASAAKK